MTKEQNIKVLTADEITITRVQEELRNRGIATRIQNDFASGVMAGFSGGIPTAIDLYVMEKDAKSALRIIDELMED